MEVNMQEYKLEIKQSVNYPRCRIYRDFVQNLIADTGIRVNGENLLFHYTVFKDLAPPFPAAQIVFYIIQTLLSNIFIHFFLSYFIY